MLIGGGGSGMGFFESLQVFFNTNNHKEPDTETEKTVETDTQSKWDLIDFLPPDDTKYDPVKDDPGTGTDPIKEDPGTGTNDPGTGTEKPGDDPVKPGDDPVKPSDPPAKPPQPAPTSDSKFTGSFINWKGR